MMKVEEAWGLTELSAVAKGAQASKDAKSKCCCSCVCSALSPEMKITELMGIYE